ncbi:hypothetical protein M569_13482 [Genlisea aurea]|uniref:USP domain-containing protein n=1 Tax=Genlisea aurea TaxID=192259 RepID=S8C3A3_9LAMI|nr:hypothetical protein M569_13482 [Genlisea aurea]
MGHKKRTVGPRSKPPNAQPGSAVDDSVVPDGGESKIDNSFSVSPKGVGESLDLETDGRSSGTDCSTSYGLVKVECERALTALRRGNPNKALRLMKDLSSKHEGSRHLALINRVHGAVCVKVASIITDQTTKQRHLKTALESARRAVSLSPNSVEFSHFYANLLYEIATDGKDYEEVVQECERALMIKNPVDPAKESLQEENQQKICTPEARIEHVQNDIRSLIQKSNIASISTWMKNLGNGEEKFRLIPIRRVPEDPMELRLIQTKRPNEIKKVTKTPEERRKEIEVKVAAARLMQQKSESPNLSNDGDGTSSQSNGGNSFVGSGQKAGERRRSGNIRKNGSSDEMKSWVRSYWNSINSGEKKDFLKISVWDLKAHFSSSKDVTSSEGLAEALSFGQENKIWKFLFCCRCDEKFVEASCFMQHVINEHLNRLLPEMQSVLPLKVDDEWAEMLLNYDWKPLELHTAIQVYRKRSKSGLDDFHAESCQRNDMNDLKQHEWASPLTSGNCADEFTHIPIESNEFENVEWMECDGDQDSNLSLLNENWPVSDDPERLKLLEKIQAIFGSLVSSKCLASSHLCKVLNFAVEELQSLGCSSLSKLEKSPLPICLLGAPELKKILSFLQEISNACGANRYPDKSNGIDFHVLQGVDMMDKIRFSEDGSYLILDEDFIHLDSLHPSGDDDVKPSALLTPAQVKHENGFAFDSDSFLSWIFRGPSSSEQLASWTRSKEEKTQQVQKILQSLEKETCHLQALCDRKYQHLNYEEALQTVEDLCLEAGKKREHLADIENSSYDSILRKRQEELVENQNEDNVVANRFQLEAITNVLKDAGSISVNQFGLEDGYSCMTSHLCDLESGEDDWRVKDNLHQVDSCIEVALQRQKEQVSVEISKIDARILRLVAEMRQFEVKLELASSLDFQSLLIPLVKSFLRARLEDLAEKDAREKSDAAREAFLAELAQDSTKGTSIVIDNSKHVHEKVKDKKKHKESRKNKDMKAKHYDELSNLNAEEIGHDEDGQGFEIADSGSDDCLLREEEQKLKIELEAEERKLEETLEYQRRMENEAKQKHLAEQHKRITKVAGPSAATNEHSDAYLGCDDENKCSHEHWSNERNDEDAASEDLLSKESSKSALLSNDGYVWREAGSLLSKISGKKSRQHKDPTRSNDEKLRHIALPKEDGSAAPQPIYLLKSSADSDNGGKTLRQLKAEEEDEERFQADLKKAVRQSLDAFHAHRQLPLVSSSLKLQKDLPDSVDFSLRHDNEVTGNDAYGTGLRNEVGEYNCFLNVIIQSLWHVRRFRDEFLRRSLSKHIHVGDPCVTCALYEIFIALSMMSKDNKRDAVAPTSLRVSLSNLYPNSNFFQEGQMNDASEVLGVIFHCLHQSFASPASVSLSAAESVTGSWDCSDPSCIAHSIFGMDAMCSEYSFDELLNLVEMNHQLACDPDAGGCGKLNYIHHILSSPPHVFTTVLGWQNTSESVDDIKATLSALSMEIDISALYRGLDPQTKHALVSVVCYYGQHYHCFAFSRETEQWIMYDDKTVKAIGGWDDVIAMCEKGHLQPQVLLFEAAAPRV